MITLEDFKKLDIRIGKVISAERIPDSDKLIKFIFDIGGEQRQILAGIAEFFPDLEILIGKEMPLLLNIEPRKLRGYMSEGMVMAVDSAGSPQADSENGPVLLCPEKEVPPGSLVK